jgi:hypothetical protein
MQPYRPPQAVQDAKIAKITSCDDLFAAISFNGELFTFSAPSLADVDASGSKERSNFKPQRVWALRKKFTAVKVCTPWKDKQFTCHISVGRRAWF